MLERKELGAADYSYRFPDHWILHDRDPDTLFAQLHGYYIGRVSEIVKDAGVRTVLDVGCGDGWSSGRIASSGLDVVGIDWSENAITYAKALAPNVRFFVADVRDADFRSRFPDGFDAVTLIEVLEHIPPDDCVDALRSIISPLKVGGTFVLTTPSVNFPNRNPQHYRHFTEFVLRDLVMTVGGLSISAVEGYGDVAAERSHYRWARWVDNRFFALIRHSLI